MPKHKEKAILSPLSSGKDNYMRQNIEKQSSMDSFKQFLRPHFYENNDGNGLSAMLDVEAGISSFEILIDEGDVKEEISNLEDDASSLDSTVVSSGPNFLTEVIESNGNESTNEMNPPSSPDTPINFNTVFLPPTSLIKVKEYNENNLSNDKGFKLSNEMKTSQTRESDTVSSGPEPKNKLSDATEESSTAKVSNDSNIVWFQPKSLPNITEYNVNELSNVKENMLTNEMDTSSTENGILTNASKTSSTPGILNESNIVWLRPKSWSKIAELNSNKLSNDEDCELTNETEISSTREILDSHSTVSSGSRSLTGATICNGNKLSNDEDCELTNATETSSILEIPNVSNVLSSPIVIKKITKYKRKKLSRVIDYKLTNATKTESSSPGIPNDTSLVSSSNRFMTKLPNGKECELTNATETSLTLGIRNNSKVVWFQPKSPTDITERNVNKLSTDKGCDLANTMEASSTVDVPNDSDVVWFHPKSLTDIAENNGNRLSNDKDCELVNLTETPSSLENSNDSNAISNKPIIVNQIIKYKRVKRPNVIDCKLTNVKKTSSTLEIPHDSNVVLYRLRSRTVNSEYNGNKSSNVKDCELTNVTEISSTLAICNDSDVVSSIPIILTEKSWSNVKYCKFTYAKKTCLTPGVLDDTNIVMSDSRSLTKTAVHNENKLSNVEDYTLTNATEVSSTSANSNESYAVPSGGISSTEITECNGRELSNDKDGQSAVANCKFNPTKTTFTDTPVYKCNFCKLKSVSLLIIKRHVSVHSAEVSKQDAFYPRGAESESTRALAAPLDSENRSQRPAFSKISMYRCDKCAFGTDEHAKIKLHVSNHDISAAKSLLNVDDRYFCAACQFKCKTEYSLNEHRRVHHSEEMLRCHLCPFTCTESNYLQWHKLTHAIHSGLQTSLSGCRITDIATAHVNENISLEYKCFNCSFSCVKSEDLKEHRCLVDEIQTQFKNSLKDALDKQLRGSSPECSTKDPLRKELHVSLPDSDNLKNDTSSGPKVSEHQNETEKHSPSAAFADCNSLEGAASNESVDECEISNDSNAVSESPKSCSVNTEYNVNELSNVKDCELTNATETSSTVAISNDLNVVSSVPRILTRIIKYKRKKLSNVEDCELTNATETSLTPGILNDTDIVMSDSLTKTAAHNENNISNDKDCVLSNATETCSTREIPNDSNVVSESPKSCTVNTEYNVNELSYVKDCELTNATKIFSSLEILNDTSIVSPESRSLTKAAVHNENELSNVEDCQKNANCKFNSTKTTFTDTPMYQCNFCTFKSVHLSTMERHLSLHGAEILSHDGEKSKLHAFYPYSAEVLSVFKELQSTRAPDASLDSENRSRRPAFSKISTYRCDKCAFGTDEPAEIKLHVLHHDLSAAKPVFNVGDWFFCAVCQFKCKTEYSLKEHHRVRHSEEKLRCHLCPFTCTESHYLEWHGLTHIFRNGLQTSLSGCEILKIIKTHTNKNAPMMYKCVSCSFSCVKSEDLKDHRCLVNEIQTQFKNSLKDALDKQLRGSSPECSTKDPLRKELHVSLPDSDNLKNDTSSGPKVSELEILSPSAASADCNSLEGAASKESVEYCGIPLNEIQAHVELYKCNGCAFEYKKIYDIKKGVFVDESEEEFQMRRRGFTTEHVTTYTCTDCCIESPSLSAVTEQEGIIQDETPKSDDVVSYSDVNQFSCQQSQYQTVDKNTFDSHVLKHSDKKPRRRRSGPFDCRSASSLSAHVIKRTRYKCDVCIYCTDDMKDLAEHKMIHDDKKFSIREAFKCVVCSFDCVSLEHLEAHAGIHAVNRRYQCDVCPFKALHPRGLEQHKRTHSVKQSFACGLCDFQTTVSSVLKIHVSSKHSEEGRHRCGLCSFTCETLVDLRLHFTSHKGGKQFLCHLCTYCTTSLIQFEEHIASRHS